MTTTPELQNAMTAIAAKKGDFALFALLMRADSPGRWDLVVAAPWLEVGKLKELREFIRLLDKQLGERKVRQFERIVTLESRSPEIRAELAALDIDVPGRTLYNTTIFGADVLEGHILRAKPPRNGADARRNKPLRATRNTRKTKSKPRLRSARA